MAQPQDTKQKQPAGQPRQRDALRYAADLIGAGAAVYLGVTQLLRLLLGLLVGAVWQGATLAQPTGVPEVVMGLVNLALTFTGLYLAVRFLRAMAAPTLCPKLKYTDPRDRRLWLFLPVFVGMGLLGDVASALLREALAKHTAYTAPQETQLPENGVALLLYFIAMCILPAILEEMLCRGMMQGLLRRWGVWFSVVVTAVLFTLLHGDVAQMPAIFVLALFLGLTAHTTDSLMPGMVLHLVNNIVSFLFLLAQERMPDISALGVVLWLLAVLWLAAGVCVARIVQLHLLRTLKPIPKVYDAKNRQSRVLRLATSPLFMAVMVLLAARAVWPLFAKG